MRSLVLVAVTLLAVAPSAQAKKPFTVPALREWKAAHGTYRLPKKPRIAAPKRLHGVARTLAGELNGRVTRRHGDIRLKLGATGLPKEGYRLKIARSGIRIAARTPTGAFWATRTLVQLKRAHSRIPKGSARDWPRYPDRGL